MLIDFFETKRLILRKVTEADAASLFSVWSDPAVTRFMNIDTFTNVEQAEQMIHFLNQLADENRAVRYTLTEKKTDQVIGSCGFNSLDFENAKAEIGYDLGQPYWGNGYAGEAVLCLIDYAFHHLQLMRVEAKAEPENLSSIRVLQKTGFSFEGILRKSEKSKGTFIDLALYSRLKTD